MRSALAAAAIGVGLIAALPAVSRAADQTTGRLLVTLKKRRPGLT